MNGPPEFRAPWGRALRIVTVGATAVCLGVSGLGLFVVSEANPIARWGMVILPLLIVGGSALFAVCGYSIEGEQLIVHRPGWDNRFDLSSLRGVEFDPEAARRSIRLAGNGGLFAFCGWFRNRKLGTYRAFATDPRRTVVLRMAERTLVVTPDAPERFVERVSQGGRR